MIASEAIIPGAFCGIIVCRIIELMRSRKELEKIR
jgi:hypothetical protein